MKKMKLTPEFLKNMVRAFLVCACLQGSALALEFGDKVSTEEIRKATVIQGELPEEWEEGKLYLLECWATWCGPCIALIPHIEELHQTYKERGLVVLGMNVREDGEDKVRKFVEARKDMSYPVAYVGKGGPFESAWIDAAGITFIPQTFLVKNGVLLFHTNPETVSAGMIESLLEGGEAAKAVIERQSKKAENSELRSQYFLSFRKAVSNEDVAAAELALKVLRDLDPQDSALNFMDALLGLLKKDWALVQSMLEKDSREGNLVFYTIGNYICPGIDEEEGVSPSLLTFLLSWIENEDNKKYFGEKTKWRLGLWIRLHQKLGNQDGVAEVGTALLAESLEDIQNGKNDRDKFLAREEHKILENFVESQKGTNPLSLQDLNKLYRELDDKHRE